MQKYFQIDALLAQNTVLNAQKTSTPLLCRNVIQLLRHAISQSRIQVQIQIRRLCMVRIPL